MRTSICWFVGSLLLVSAGVAVAADLPADRFGPADLARLAAVGEPAFAPDGESIVYTVTVTNAAEVIRRNAPFISINTSMGVDFFGNVWADFVDARRYYSGVGGQPDFARALNDSTYGTAIIAIKSVTDKGESKFVKVHPPGVALTVSSYDSVVIVNEYGIADLRGLTAGEKAMAIASIAHPKYREDYLREIHDDPMFTKPRGFAFGDTPRGVKYYKGDIRLD